MEVGEKDRKNLRSAVTVTVFARDKIKMLLERIEDIWCMMVVQSFHKVLLSEHRKKNSSSFISITPQPL